MPQQRTFNLLLNMFCPSRTSSVIISWLVFVCASVITCLSRCYLPRIYLALCTKSIECTLFPCITHVNILRQPRVCLPVGIGVYVWVNWSDQRHLTRHASPLTGTACRHLRIDTGVYLTTSRIPVGMGLGLGIGFGIFSATWPSWCKIPIS